MKKLFELGNRYVEQSDWTDFAFVKLCLGAMGVMIGVCIPKENKKTTQAIAGTVFGVTYVILMRRMIGVILKMKEEV